MQDFNLYYLFVQLSHLYHKDKFDQQCYQYLGLGLDQTECSSPVWHSKILPEPFSISNPELQTSKGIYYLHRLLTLDGLSIIEGQILPPLLYALQIPTIKINPENLIPHYFSNFNAYPYISCSMWHRAPKADFHIYNMFLTVSATDLSYLTFIHSSRFCLTQSPVCMLCTTTSASFIYFFYLL